ncbi:MAG: ABC transporter permease [Bacteroidota bacterium]
MRPSDKHIIPPKWLLRLFIKKKYLEEIEGDMEERFQDNLERYSIRKARRLYAWDTLKLFRPLLMKNIGKDYQLNQYGMLKHNLVLALRNFKRYKTSFLINVIGLSTGLACTLLIYLWVNDELSVDKFHEKDIRLYQVMQNLQYGNGIETQDLTPAPLAKALLEEIPEVEYAVAVNDFFSLGSREGIFSYEDNRIEASGWFAGNDYFNVFSYDLIKGDRDHVLTDKSNVVISERLAKKIFGSTEGAIGETLEWNHSSFSNLFQVSGIFKNLPHHSTAQFDFLMSIEVLLDNDHWAKAWTGNYAETYLILREGTNVPAFNKKIANFLKSKDARLDDEFFNLFVQQYSRKYLYGQYQNGIPVGGRASNVKLFSIIAVFILLIACTNFVNLSTAQASRKMKEIGVKKAMGAKRKVLMTRFLIESILVVFISLLVAFLLVVLLLPVFNDITGKHIQPSFDFNHMLASCCIFILAVFISGAYPAFYLSGFSPITVLKGKFKTSTGGLWLRKSLVVFQFTLSIIFIVGLLIINQQIEFAQTKNMGYNRDNIIKFQWKGTLYNPWNGLRDGKSNIKFDAFMQALKEVRGVVNTTNMSGNILDKIVKQSDVSWRDQDSDRYFLFQSPVVGYDYLKTLGIELVAGRTFSKEHNDDYSKVILNAAAVKHMELENPIGRIIKMNGGSEIIGVVKDFHYGSLHNTIEPLIFRLEPHGRNILARIETGAEKATIKRIKELYMEFLLGYVFDFSFLDDDYQALYASEQRVAILSRYFAAVAIVISCLGLFGLAAFTTERRVKEIGIRKILGSGVFGIVRLLSSDFSKMVLIAIIIALPLSYITASRWLDSFAYRIDLQWWYFIGAGSLALLIACFTVGMQTIKAAKTNPVDCLRNE